MSSILIHIVSSPYNGLAAKEGLDLAMVLATFEQKVDLAFSGAGIALLYMEQSPTIEHGKALYKMLPSFEFYDLNNLYVPVSAILDNQLGSQLQNELGNQLQNEKNKMQISPLATLVTDDEWQQILTRHTHIFRF